MADWPNYDVGTSPESLFALGVVSVNYARLEFALEQLFSDITGTNAVFTRLLFPRITNETRLALMRQTRPLQWPAEILERLDHFLDAAAIAVENRNLLMHSSMGSSSDGNIELYKSSKRGTAILCALSLEELRQVADDMRGLMDFRCCAIAAHYFRSALAYCRRITRAARRFSTT